MCVCVCETRFEKEVQARKGERSAASIGQCSHACVCFWIVDSNYCTRSISASLMVADLS